MASNINAPASDVEHRPAIFEQVLDSELAHFGIKGHPRKPYTGAECSDHSFDCDSAYAARIVADAHAARLSGIAFSGGGIRSATFNLGVLQGLAKLNLLKEFHYLSSVSGGGYIGSWLSAWIWREHRQMNECGPPGPDGVEVRGEQERAEEQASALDKVSDKLAAAAGTGEAVTSRGALQPDPPPIWHLREYSNYLTPRRGLWSTDAWTLGAGYIRNLVLTLGVLLGTVITIVLLAQAFAAGFHELAVGAVDSGTVLNRFYLPFVALIGVASLLLGMELSPRRSANARHPVIAFAAVVLALVSAVAGALWLWSWPPGPVFANVVWSVIGLLLATMGLGFLGRWFGNHGLFADVIGGEDARNPRKTAWMAVSGLVGLAVLVGLWWFAAVNMPVRISHWTAPHLVVWGVPLVVLIYSIAAAVSVGFSGAALQEVEREWLGRFFGVLAKWTVLYTVLMVLVVYSFGAVEGLPSEWAAWEKTVKSVLAGLWAAVSAAGAYLGRGGQSTSSGWRGMVHRVVVGMAPAVFVLGLFVVTVWMVVIVSHRLSVAAASAPVDGWLGWLRQLAFMEDPGIPEPAALLLAPGYWAWAGILAIITLVVTVVWSSRVGVNDFSLHALYGNRLVRAYLGASHLRRQAHPFTGFDQNDNAVRMSDLMSTTGPGGGPYPIINSAINLVSSRRLAWQKRKAASFTFTPDFCGYEFCEENEEEGEKRNGRTGGYARSRSYGGGKGVSLGKAMTISGAAATPNMGYHSSPGLTFLMTTFNVRLGWWLPNTAKADPRLLGVRGPRMGLLYLVVEALGLTGAQDDYVYLSDGGHFENLGIYELVRRRCRFVIASDAEADPQLTFSGLGNAIEKCRTDLGVPIDIDVSEIRRNAASGRSHWHCAVGCIRYSDADPGQHDGTLLYIKASLTGDEPQDVAAYAHSHARFPHESTADQWFDETQFESYRVLGEHITLKVLRNAVENARYRRASGEHGLERIFLELRKQWYAPAVAVNANPVDYQTQLEQLLETLRTDPDLAFLDSQLYPNLQRIAARYSKADGSEAGHAAQAAGGPRLPADPEELRAGFYYCKELIQFMQDVFHDRCLDTEYSAPSNRGWMNLFRRWALSSMFHFTWVMTAGTYSARFQSFCEYHLDLDSGEPQFDSEPVRLRATAAGSARTPEVSLANTDGASGRDWRQALEDVGLHLYERTLVEEFITAYVYLDNVETLRPDLDFEVRSLNIKVDNVCPTEEGDEIALNAGFMIVGPHPDDPHHEKALIYFRIRSSMRNMDLARKAFLKIHPFLPPSGPRGMSASRRVCLDRELPRVEHGEFGNAARRRAYREIHERDPDNLCRCRWFAQLLQDSVSDQAEQTAPGGQPVSQ